MPWVRARAGAWVPAAREAAAGRKGQQLTRVSSHEDRALRNVGTRRGDGDVIDRGAHTAGDDAESALRHSVSDEFLGGRCSVRRRATVSVTSAAGG